MNILETTGIKCKECQLEKDQNQFYFYNLVTCKKCCIKKSQDYTKKRKSLITNSLYSCSRCHSRFLKFNENTNETNECRKCLRRRKNFDNKKEIKENLSERYLKNIEKIIWRSARIRAKRKGLDFNIEISDINIPEYCPVLGIKMEISTGKGGIKDNSPTLDKIIPELGYVKGNIAIISKKANLIKSNGNILEHEKILNYIKENTPDNIEYSI